jgi:hypothetical protein
MMVAIVILLSFHLFFQLVIIGALGGLKDTLKVALSNAIFPPNGR